MKRTTIAPLLCALSTLGCGTARPSRNDALPVAAIAPQCAAVEYHGLDFWIGDWDAVLRTRDRPDAETWTETRGTNHIEAVLDGCGLEESFHAGGNPPWAGKSLSRYVAAEKKWRQTWIDDSGGYLPFEGTASPQEVVLTGEARAIAGGTKQMRMVFSNIRANHFDWRWEASTDGGKTWRPALIISYTRHM